MSSFLGLRVGCREEWGVTANGEGISFGGDVNALNLDCGDEFITLNILKKKPIELYTLNRLILWYINSISFFFN